MKITQENMKRFKEMIKDFAAEHNLWYTIVCDYERNQTTIEVKQLECNLRKTLIVDWNCKKSLTDACTTIFTHLTREWNLDDGEKSILPGIKNVVFNDPTTIILWDDGSKTVVKCQDGDVYSKETGFALCIAKKALGNKGNFNEVFKKWVPEEEETETIRIDTPSFEITNSLGKLIEEQVDALLNSRKKRGLL